MLYFHDFKSQANECYIYKLVSKSDKDALGKLFNRSDEITNKLKSQIEDFNSEFGFLNFQSNIKHLTKLTKDNTDITRSIIASGDVQAQIEFHHLIFKNSMENIVVNQENVESSFSHLNSDDITKEIFIPDAYNLFRNYQGKATGGLIGNVLAKSGVKMVFIFMQRLWRVGNEMDVKSCVDVMRSAIEEIQEIPVAAFFNLSEDNETLPFWSGVTEQTYQFLKNTVICTEANDVVAPKPIRDTALVLMLEMGLIYGSLSMQLKHVIMLIELSSANRNYPNLTISANTEVPRPMITGRILSVLVRLAKFVKKFSDDHISTIDRSIHVSTNPCIKLLNWMQLFNVKDDDSMEADICLLNSAVYIMSCLDSLTVDNQLQYSLWYKAHLMNSVDSNQIGEKYESCLTNPFCSNEKSRHQLFFIALNNSANFHKNNSDNSEFKCQILDMPAEKLPREQAEFFRIKKIVYSGVNTYILSESGWLYEINNTSKEVFENFTFKHNSINYQFDHIDNENSCNLNMNNKIVDIDANVFSSHAFAVTENGQVYSWGTNISGKLGHGDTKDRKRPTIIEMFYRSHILVKRVACGEEHSLILTQDGEIYGCGRNHMGQLGLGDVKDRHFPARIDSNFYDTYFKFSQIAVDGHQSMALSTDGVIFTWGSTFDNCRRHSTNWVPKIDKCAQEYRNEIEQIQVHDSKYMILIKSGSVYSWLKNCAECNKSDDPQNENDTPLKYQMENVSMISKDDGEFYFLNRNGTIRTKKINQISEQKFSGFGFIKRNYVLAWSLVKEKPQLVQPFILEVSIENFKLLSSLISSIIVNFVTTSDREGASEKLESSNWFQNLSRINPNNKFELTEDRLCILVSSLHLLSVQLQKVVEEKLTIPSPVLTKLKRDIINCCCGAVSQLHVSIKDAAHMCLISGWKILFSSQMEKLLGIYYTLQISEPCMSRYNLIVVMCLDTSDLKQFINTLIQLQTSSSVNTNSELPTIECVIETIIKYSFTNIRSQLKLPPVTSLKLSENLISSKIKASAEFDLFSNNTNPDIGWNHSILDKIFNFLRDLLKQTVFLLRESRVTQDNLQQTLKMILTVYGKVLAQQSIETIDYCWALINKSNITPQKLISSLNNSGFSQLLFNFIESIHWLMKNYLQTKSMAKSDHKSLKGNSKLTCTNPMFHYDILFKFSMSLREILFGFRPLILSLDRINRLNESIVLMDSEEGASPGSLYNPYTMMVSMNKIIFRMKDLAESNEQLILIDDRVYDIDKLTIEARNQLDNILPGRKGIILTDLVHQSLQKKEIIKLLTDCYCGQYIEDEGQPITYFDNDSEDKSQLYFLERMFLTLLSDVLLFHQSCCSLMKRSIGFKQLQESSVDKFPPVLKQIILKKKSDHQLTNNDTNNLTVLSLSHLEEKERDEVEETNDLTNNTFSTNSNDDNNRKIINNCVNLLMYGTTSSIIDKGTSIIANVLYWLRSDFYKNKTANKVNSMCMLDNIQDPNLDTLFVLILIVFARHVNICDELANHIIQRNYDQPMGNELKIIIQQTISMRKDIIKSHQQTSTPYKELCSIITVRCQFLIDEIEILSINSHNAIRKKIISLTDFNNDISIINRWKWASLKAVSASKKAKGSIDYWQIICNCIVKKFQINKLKHCKNDSTKNLENYEKITEFCSQINLFLLNKEVIDLQKLRTLVLAKKIQYKCIINILREFKSLLIFGANLLPGVQVSLLQIFCQKVDIDNDCPENSSEKEYICDILQNVNCAASNFVGHHTKQSLLQTELMLVQLCTQLLRDNVLDNERKMESLRCSNFLSDQSHIIGVGHWPNTKINLAICNFLLQSIKWSNDIFQTMLSSGILGLIQTVFKQYFKTEPGLISLWFQKSRNYQLLSSENSIKNRSESVDDIANSEIATSSQLLKGTLVLRGRDWKYGDQDGPNSVGIVKREAVDGMVRVQWLNNKKTGSYRAGKNNFYDLRLKKSIEDVKTDNPAESGVRTLMKDINRLHEKFLENRMMRNNSSSFTKSSDSAEEVFCKLDYPCKWTQPSILLLHCMGQLMKAIAIEETIPNSSSKPMTSSMTPSNKIYQLLFLVFKNGLLSSIFKNGQTKNMYQEQMKIWCNESFLLTLLSQQDSVWPNCDMWLDLFLTKAEIQISLCSSENVLNQILTFRIIEKFANRLIINNSTINRLWDCLQKSINVHCSQVSKMKSTVNTLNAPLSKIQIMEMAIIFRNFLRDSSFNQLSIRKFIFEKLELSFSETDNNLICLAVFCLFSDIENRIYPGIPSCTVNKNGERNEVLGIVDEIGVGKSDNCMFTLNDPSSDSNNKEFDFHFLTNDLQIDAVKIQFPFDIFNSLSELESEVISKFLLMILSNFAKSNEDILMNISPLQNLFNIMQLSTIMEFCGHNFTGLWNTLYESDRDIFKPTLNIATRICSVKPTFSTYELEKALKQLSTNLFSYSPSETPVVSDDDKSSEAETEETCFNKQLLNKGHSLSLSIQSKIKKKETKYKKDTLNISSELQFRIMEMGFTKQQIRLAIRKLTRDGNWYFSSNPELIVTTILSLDQDDVYSLSLDDNGDNEEYSEDNDSVNLSEHYSSCSTVSDNGLQFFIPKTKSKHLINKITNQSVKTSDNEENVDNRIENEDFCSTDEERDDSSSSIDNSSDCENKGITSESEKPKSSDFNILENVICVKAFQTVLVGDKGCINISTIKESKACNVLWTRLNQFLETDADNIYIFPYPLSSVSIGDEVKFSESGIQHHSVSAMSALRTGIVRRIVGNDESNCQFVVDFPDYLGKICDLSHLKLISKNYHNYQCQYCLKSPLTSKSYKCKECINLFLCYDCYVKFQKCHEHLFIPMVNDKNVQKNDNLNVESSFTHCRKLKSLSVTASINKSELKQCLSFSNLLLNHQIPVKNIKSTITLNNVLVKASEGFKVNNIFMLISLSEFLLLPCYVIVKVGSKSRKLSIAYRADVNSLKEEELIMNSPMRYSPESKLMWLKIFEEKTNSTNRIYSLDLFDDSCSDRIVFNGVKSFHFQLSKIHNSVLRRNRNETSISDFSVSANNDALLKTVYSICEKNWYPTDIDKIANNTIVSWRKSRMNKLHFQISLNMRQFSVKDAQFDAKAQSDNSKTTENESNCQDDNRIKNRLKSKVYVWGLNDKDQLGCEATSKVKLPILNEVLSEYDCVSISGGSKSLFCVTRTGKVYVAGDPSNGRLGIGIITDASLCPKKIESLEKYFIIKVAVHSGGRHAMALTKNGEVFSWGEGDDGKLGHNSRLNLEYPRKIKFFKGKRVHDIACGSSHSSAIVFGGNLYTWGLGDYGRLGHGDTLTKLVPELVKALREYRVVQVACGSRDAQTLALTSDYTVWSWGDGDFGKLGRGGSSGCLIPQKIESLSSVNVIQIECGAQSSFALTEIGQVWTWGKGDYYRLGHGQDKHVREPMLVEDLRDTKIVHLAVGALHCLAVTDQGYVYSWGDNDHGQQGNGTVSYNMRPTLITALANVKIVYVACGSSHSVAWTASDFDSFMVNQSVNRWPQVKEMSYPLSVLDLCPVPFPFSPDPLGAGDLLDCYQNIFQKKTKCIESTQEPGCDIEQISDSSNVPKLISQLRGQQLKTSIIQSLFINLQILIARKLVFQLIGQKNHQLSQTSLCQSEFENSALSVNEQLSSIDLFLLIFDYLKLYNFTSSQSVIPLNDFLKNIGFNSSINFRQTALLLLISEIDKYGDIESNKSNSIYVYCDNKEFVNIIKKSRFTSVVRESPHPYQENLTLNGKIVIPDALRLMVEFDRQCSTERNKDILTFKDHTLSIVAERSGQRWEDWNSKIIINGNELHWSFKSDGSISAWGWKFEVKPLFKQYSNHKHDDDVYSNEIDKSELFTMLLPNLQLIKAVLDGIELQFEDTALAVQLIKSLSQMAFTRAQLDLESRIWTVRQITSIICNLKLGVFSQFMKAVDCFSVMYSRFDTKNVTMDEDICDQVVNFDIDPEELSSDEEQTEKSTQLISDMDTICNFLLCLQKVVLKQFKFEEPEVKSSKQLLYSRFLKSLIDLSCQIRLDSLTPVSSADEWAWFRNYCLTYRTTEALITNTSLPYRFLNEFKCRFLKEPTVKDPLITEINAVTAVSEYADPREFSFQHDVQLIGWLKSRPDAWKKCWPTDSASGLEVWSWGHNHRGQLGGVEGSKIKVPVLCEHLSALRPKQIIGGEQSLFIVSTDGRVYATGFGNNGRLGIGSSESVQTPILVSGLEEKLVVKVAVNSGGKHCLALCNNGLVYAWGDAEDHKLGLDIRLQPGEDVLTPTLVKSLVKAEIVDIAAGGSHSAAISRSGELYTWGKGRYGRLGHGNGDDQPFPKIIDALRGCHVIGVACGSGDAQTLCITKALDDTREEIIPNTSVWSWGDGDYGKLGRGGFDICKLPMKIETLEGAGVIKVDCGSQFSLALTASGEIFTWGKGDYFRLGHGSDAHVRKPEKVAQLSRKKIIDVACGSLHCICCTEDGEVYSWGDNDEGQLGDGTTTTNSRPRIIETLTGKGINRVACGSAHTLAWTTVSGNRSHESETPDQRLSLSTRPSFCSLLENKSAQSLINRFLLLHHWTELFCCNLHFFDLNKQSLMDTVRQILLPTSKESLFRLMIQTTMYGSKKHGPEIKVNRLHASAGTPAGVSILHRSGWIESDNQVEESNRRSFGELGIGNSKIQIEKTVFGQLGSKLIEEADCISKNSSIYVPPPDFFLLPNRVWKVKLIGESVDDCGGGYSESITEICDELQNGHLPFLISSPDKDCFLISPNTEKTDLRWFIFLGCLLGIAIRTNQPLSLTISDLIWKILSGQSLNQNDLQLLDKDLFTSLLSLKTMDDNELESLQIPYTVTTIDYREINLNVKDEESESVVTVFNRDKYIEATMYYKVHEFDQVCSLIRRGMSLVIPLPLLNLFSSRELECLVCGNDSIPISFLKSITLYRGVKSDDPIILWFWEIMEEMTNEVRSLFLRFVWGRTRLPRYVSDLRGKEFVIQVLNKYSPADDYLPEAYTCFFLLKLPSYTGKAILQEKLLYAIHFCKSIDIDDYARIALNPDSLPCQETVPTFPINIDPTNRRDRENSQSSSSGSTSPRIYISNSSSSSTSSQDDDSDVSTALAPNALFDSSLSLTDRYPIQRNNQYLVSDYMDLINGAFDPLQFIDMSLDTEVNDDDTSDDDTPYNPYM